jgi:hypothetical protein
MTQNITAVDSSMIASLSYNQNEGTLLVTYKNGGKYLYNGIDQTTFDSLSASASDPIEFGSLGKKFHAYGIRDMEFTKIA